MLQFITVPFFRRRREKNYAIRLLKIDEFDASLTRQRDSFRDCIFVTTSTGCCSLKYHVTAITNNTLNTKTKHVRGRSVYVIFTNSLSIFNIMRNFRCWKRTTLTVTPHLGIQLRMCNWLLWNSIMNYLK